MTKQDIEDSAQRFKDEISAGRYYFEPYSLNYFNRYSSIVKGKALLLLNIIEKIGNRDSISIQDVLTDLDIQLDENGNILREDIIRLITPVVHNISKLNEKVLKANELTTYLTFKLSTQTLYRDGWSESEIYPPTSIQVKNLEYDYIKGNVPLSTSQKEVLKAELRRSMRILSKTLLD